MTRQPVDHRGAGSDAPSRLATAMSELSEEQYCAGWLIDTEFYVWAMLVGDAPLDWGFGAVEPSAIEEIRALSEEANGWVVWRGKVERDAGTVFVPMAEWLPMYEARWAEFKAKETT